MAQYDDTPISEMIGKKFSDVYANEDQTELIFIGVDEKFTFYHDQDCCEGVSINEIHGDLEDLVGEPLLLAEEATSSENPQDLAAVPEYQDSFTWTFYKFATRKGYVTVRWYGESNGYYSESVSLRVE
jgi:hypothetical protein